MSQEKVGHSFVLWNVNSNNNNKILSLSKNFIWINLILLKNAVKYTVLLFFLYYNKEAEAHKVLYPRSHSK